MVLWCFNVTVPDLVSLRCYQRLKPQPTKNKVGSVSHLFFSFSFGAVFVDLFAALCLLGAVFWLCFLLFPLVAKARHMEKAACSL